MILADKKYFTKEHFEKNSGYAPDYLCELVVYCMELLSQLAKRELDFRFKGGNSLLLILDKPERFSIDIDIASVTTKENLISIMEDIEKNCDAFTKLEIRQHKTKPWLPMISFKIYFDSFYQKPEEAYVMLDAVLEPVPYEGVKVKVKVGEIYESDMEVEVATPAGLIGDKLLTIGPSTLGIPIGKNKEAQRLKHVFDISRLAELNPDPAKVKESVVACMKQENRIQKTDWDLTSVVDDTIKFCDLPQNYGTPPDPQTVKDRYYLYEIAVGYPEFKKFLINIDYTWDLFKADLLKIKGIMENL